jgi:hypothetical protein
LGFVTLFNATVPAAPRTAAAPKLTSAEKHIIIILKCRAKVPYFSPSKLMPAA